MYQIRVLLTGLLLAVVAVAVAGCFQAGPAKKKLPRRVIIPIRPIVPNRPAPRRPCPGPGPCPRENVLAAKLSPTVAGRVSPDGVPVECDYPGDRMQKNLAGIDHKGLCVFASASLAMDWHGVRGGHDFLQWMQRKEGGGWPEKFDAMMTEYFQSIGQPVPPYKQMQGTDVQFVIDSLAQGKMVCCTYYRSPTGRYSGERISHMVNVAHHDGERVAVADNNFIGEDQYEWLPADVWLKAASDSQGRLWAIAFDLPSPPPVPHN